MALTFKNNASTTLSGAINNTQSSITVVNGSNFPVVTAGGDFFYATMYEVSGSNEINIEIIKVTATSGNLWTIERAQDGTTARSRSDVVTCYVELRLTAAGANEMLQKALNLSDLANAGTARTNLGLGTMATQASSNVNITGGSISGVSLTNLDSTTTFVDNADSTKKLAFEVSGVSSGTTRTLTVPNASGTIALTSDLTAGYQPLDSELTALAALAANGIIARTGSGTVAVRSLAAPTAGFTITNSDGVSGNPTFALANDLAGVEGITTTGFVKRTAADTWTAAAIADGDLPSALTGKTYNALSLTSNATGFSVAGGTTSKTLSVQNNITLAGTDGTTITLPATTGTVALNSQTFFLGTTSVAINRGSSAISLSGVSIDGSAGSATTATTATKATNLVGGNTTTLLGSIGYQSAVDTTTLLGPNTTSTKQFLSQTGTGTNGAAPTWSAVTKSDVGLGSVENTALSTWAGSTNITTLGTVATGTWNATAIGVTKGGTGATTASAGFNALSPITTTGDIIYGSAANTSSRLAGNTTTTRRFLRQVGDGTNSAAPAWDALQDGDVPTALTGKTYNALSLTANATGFQVAGGTTSKTLVVSNSLTLSGTDSSTLNIGAGGTLGTAAFTASTAYAPAAGSSSITTVGTIGSGIWQGSTIGLSYGGTGATSKSGAFNALSPVTTLGDLVYGDAANSNARLAGNITTSKRFLTQTGTGTVSAAPGWNAIVDGDLPSALTGKTYDGLSLTANATGFSVAGGTTSKTLAVSNNLTLSGTDGSTLNIGGGGTLGSAAYTASTAYAPSTGSSSITTLGTIATGTWNATTISVPKGGTGATTLTGLVKGNGTGAFSEAVAGSDYVIPSALSSYATVDSPTFTGSISAASLVLSGAATLNGNVAMGDSSADGIYLYGTVLTDINFLGSAQRIVQVGVNNGGAGNSLNLRSGAAVSSGNTAHAGGTLFLNSGTGTALSSATVNANNTSGSGGAVSLFTGAGRDLAVGVTSTAGFNSGGASGAINIFTSSGGTGSGNSFYNKGGNAGIVNIYGGVGGTAIGGSTAYGGIGASVLITGGNGGTATGAGTNISGDAGSVAILSGEPGSGSTNANAGDVNIQTGRALGNGSALIQIGTGALAGQNKTITIGNTTTTTALGLNATTITLTGTLNAANLTASKAVFTDASKNLTTTGTLGVAQGGTGATTLTGLVKGNGTSAFTAAVAGTDYVAPSALSSYLPLTGGILSASLGVGVSSLTNYSGYNSVQINGNSGAIYDIQKAGTRVGTFYFDSSLKVRAQDGAAIEFGSLGGTTRATFGGSGGFDLATGLREAKVTMGANDIDVRAGNVFTKTISTATTLTVSNVPATGTAASFILDLTSGGAFTITWWSGVKWASGTAPTLTFGGRDVLGFFTHDGGTNWTGLLLAKDVR